VAEEAHLLALLQTAAGHAELRRSGARPTGAGGADSPFSSKVSTFFRTSYPFIKVSSETLYLQHVIESLRAGGVEVRDEDLAHLSPVRFELLNRLGKYTFPRRVEVQPNGLRPLRTPTTRSNSLG
jgi:hypothetical protein